MATRTTTRIRPWALRPEYFVLSGGTYVPCKTYWRRARRRLWLKKYMTEQGCAHCGTKDTRVLTFDHIDPSTKSFTILNNMGPISEYNGVPALIQEVRKCQVLCQNCHKIKTEEENDTSNALNCEDKRLADFNKFHEEVK